MLIATLAQGVADAAHRVDQAWLAAGLGLLAQVADVHVERVRAVAEVVAPDAVEDHRPRQHLPRVAQEQLEQRELGPRQDELLAATGHLAGTGVQLEVGEAERGRLVVGAESAQKRPDARDELLEGERLDEVVVGAGLEACDAVGDLVARGQHQDRELAPVGPQPAGELEPVEPRHQDVDDREVELFGFERSRSSASSPSPASSTS